MPKYELPTEAYDNDEPEASSPLREALTELDRVTRELDQSIGLLGERLSPLRVDRPQKVPDELTKQARAHSDMVQIIADVVDRLRTIEHRVEALHAELEI